MADERAIQAQEYRLLLARVEEHLDEADTGLAAVSDLEERFEKEDVTLLDSGLEALEQIAVTRDACNEAVHVLALELMSRGARAKDVAAAAHTTPNTVFRWKREAAI